MKHNFIKKLLYIVTLVGALLLVLSGCGNSNNSSLQGIKKKGTLTVGMISSNPPYEFQTSKNGKTVMSGSDVRLVKKVAKSLGVKYKIKTMDLDGMLPAMQAHKVDMLITSMSPTPERKQGAKFSDVYYKSTNTLVVRKSDAHKYQDTNNFKDASIAVVNNSTQEPMIKKAFPNAPMKKLGKVTDLALAVNNGKADAFSIDIPTATILLKQNPNLTITSWRHHDSSAGAAVALPKNADKDLIKAINKVIAQNKTDYAKWVLEYAKQVN
ncbi:transporter substrate-binding domain-containing protein [Secundilactobacillus mixtipabuli]|uniref:Amino acid ABC transporter substrate-binding and permease protein n=1 Tax=Secundilactobacillus mixtipabuli TaxID=1435342 RepID=A0A1Z5IAW1_9LACO|nr:transporter substrate-binding domain-containing protein [Secundilactobacillus mixtipabuli]GAW98946.1 amino acid ABC transporter substrate-binding and permease protein [Secundilactobacillus mixtipabuli]